MRPLTGLLVSFSVISSSFIPIHGASDSKQEETKKKSKFREREASDDLLGYPNLDEDSLLNSKCPRYLELRWQSEVRSSIYATPLVADINSDGKLEIVVPSFVHYLEVLEGTDGDKVSNFITYPESENLLQDSISNSARNHDRPRSSGSSHHPLYKDLLQMFGLPYIIAPMEAEAQCAYMEISNLVDDVVTDDSDVFLFGARNVYKNIFDDRKYVETYFMKFVTLPARTIDEADFVFPTLWDIETELGLTRETLIRMALLLGSDYTEGVRKTSEDPCVSLFGGFICYEDLELIRLNRDILTF